MILRNHPIRRGYARGLGPYYQIGNNIFMDTLKTIGRKINLKEFFNRIIKPRAIDLGKKGLEYGKEFVKENIKDIQNIIFKQSKDMLKKLGEDKPIKQVYKQTKDSFVKKGAELMNKNKQKISSDMRAMLDNLAMEGDGLKITF